MFACMPSWVRALLLIREFPWDSSSFVTSPWVSDYTGIAELGSSASLVSLIMSMSGIQGGIHGNGNRKRSKNQFSVPEEKSAVFPRNVWYTLSRSAKSHALFANASYTANDTALNIQNQSMRQQSRMSLQIIAQMSGAMPGSHTDGSCPVLLRDLAESTKALVMHQRDVRAYCAQNRVILEEIANYEPSSRDNTSDQGRDPTVERLLAFKGLVQTLATYPTHLLYEHDASPFEVDPGKDDIMVA